MSIIDSIKPKEIEHLKYPITDTKVKWNEKKCRNSVRMMRNHQRPNLYIIGVFASPPLESGGKEEAGTRASVTTEGATQISSRVNGSELR